MEWWKWIILIVIIVIVLAVIVVKCGIPLLDEFSGIPPDKD